jgi:hypothetical protein
MIIDFNPGCTCYNILLHLLDLTTTCAVHCTEVLRFLWIIPGILFILFDNNNNYIHNAYPWQTLQRVGGVSAIIILALMPIQMVVFLNWPPPNTVVGWFLLFQNNPLVGLIDMDLLLIIDYVLMLMVFLALWAYLRRANESLMAIALILQVVATATYFASTAAFEMLSLSNQYTAANTDVEKSMLLAAGYTMLATWQGTAFNVGYVLGGIALVIVSAVILRSHCLFSKVTGYAGLAAGALALVPASAGMIGLLFSLVSLVPTAIWLALIDRRLLQSRPIQADPLSSK